MPGFLKVFNCLLVLDGLWNFELPAVALPRKHFFGDMHTTILKTVGFKVLESAGGEVRSDLSSSIELESELKRPQGIDGTNPMCFLHDGTKAFASRFAGDNRLT